VLTQRLSVDEVSLNGRPSGYEHLGVGQKTGNVLAKVHAVAGTPCNNRASILIECEYYFFLESVQATFYFVISFDKQFVITSLPLFGNGLTCFVVANPH
jgi:hypothetical protein